MKRQHQSSEDASTSKMPSAKRSKPSENNNIVTPSQLDDLALDGPVNEQISGPPVEAGVEKLMKKKKSEKKKEKIKALEQQIKEIETKICLKENQNAQLQLKFDNLSKQCKYFEQKSHQVETQNADYRKIIKAKEDSNSEQQRNHEKLYQKWEAEKQKFDLKLEQLENEFRGTLKAKDDKIGGLKTELEEIRQEMLSKQNDIDQANFENENLIEELSKAGDEIAILKGQKGVPDKNVNQPVVKNMEVELAEARSKCKSFEAQMKIQRESYELKLEAAKAENQSLSALNYQIKGDKEKYEKEISLLQKSVEELQKLVQEESNTCNHFRNRYLELVNERTTKNGQLYQLKVEINEVKQYCKNVEQMILDEKTKLQKIGAELYKLEKELDEKINLFTSLNSKIKAEKEKIEKEFAEYQTFISNRNLNVFTAVSTQPEDTVSSSTEATAPSTAAPTTTTANKKGNNFYIQK
uniref:Uncharacterized protein n=1 Tax=Panagrolaimus davidi TaxID=227884 RepID=A0A914PB72_9BILA